MHVCSPAQTPPRSPCWLRALHLASSKAGYTLPLISCRPQILVWLSGQSLPRSGPYHLSLSPLFLSLRFSTQGQLFLVSSLSFRCSLLGRWSLLYRDLHHSDIRPHVTTYYRASSFAVLFFFFFSHNRRSEYTKYESELDKYCYRKKKKRQNDEWSPVPRRPEAVQAAEA